MTKDLIITLDNNIEYVLLDEQVLDNKKYFYAVAIDKNEEPTNDYVILEEFQENNKFYVKEVKDKDMLGLLVTLFTKNYVESVEELEEA